MEKEKNNTNKDANEQSSVFTLDLTGLKCPLPVLKARRQIGQMASGAVLVILADDPAAPLDFDHFCHTGGHKCWKAQKITVSLSLGLLNLLRSNWKAELDAVLRVVKGSDFFNKSLLRPYETDLRSVLTRRLGKGQVPRKA